MDALTTDFIEHTCSLEALNWCTNYTIRVIQRYIHVHRKWLKSRDKIDHLQKVMQYSKYAYICTGQKRENSQCITTSGLCVQSSAKLCTASGLSQSSRQTVPLAQGLLVQNYSTTSNASTISQTTVYRPFWWILAARHEAQITAILWNNCHDQSSYVTTQRPILRSIVVRHHAITGKSIL